jgi:hypothetical protein
LGYMMSKLVRQGTSCPRRFNTFTQRVTVSGSWKSFSRLPKGIVPFGATLETLANTDVHECIRICSGRQTCKGIQWHCQANSNGKCVLKTKLSNPNSGPSNCPECVGYLLVA